MHVIVRRHEDQIVAFVNVCAHRHARRTHVRCGSSERLRCQYHGWEYRGADGEVLHVGHEVCPSDRAAKSDVITFVRLLRGQTIRDLVASLV